MFKAGERKGVLLTSKHENSVSYNQSISLAANAKRKSTVVIIVDSISRKYFTGEISWLWDIDFEKLNSPSVEKVILSGKYAFDLANRFYYTDIPQNKIELPADKVDTFVKMLDALEDLDDVQNVYHNVDLPDEDEE